MNAQLAHPGPVGPVVVGALGGSGTRLVASMLIELGFYLGEDLNRERDNLWFTLLFKRPRWYARAAREQPDEIATGLRVLERAMTGTGPLDPVERGFVRAAALEALLGRHGHARGGTTGWPLKQARGIVHAAYGPPRTGPWGWKEPNSHLYIKPLALRFSGLRFIYVLRHGLDMAYSGNRQQLHNWGPLFGVGADAARASAPCAMLDYWIRASQRAISEGRRLLGSRFLALNYDALCTRPKDELPALLAFLGVDADGPTVDRLAALAERPASLGRYRGHDRAVFDPAALDAVRELGFVIE